MPEGRPRWPIEPRTRSRRLIGYATRDPELMRLALTLPTTLDAGAGLSEAHLHSEDESGGMP